MTCKIKISGAWKDADDVQVKVSGAWKPAASVYVKESGAWKQCAGTSTPTQPLTGAAKAYITPPASHSYADAKNSLSYEYLERTNPSGVFPDGPRMFIAGFQPASDQLEIMKESGFSVAGPIYGGGTHSFMNTVALKGMKFIVMFAKMHAIRTNFNANVDTSSKLQSVINIIKGEMDAWMAANDNAICGWAMGLDDYRDGSKYPQSNNYTAYNAIVDAVHAHDPKKRPVCDANFSNLYLSASHPNYAAKMDNYACQAYYHGGDFVGDGDGGWWSRYWLAQNAKKFRQLADKYAGPNGKPQIGTALSLFAFQPSIVKEHNFAAFHDKEFLHDALVHLLNGGNGLYWYQPNTSYPGGSYPQPPCTVYNSDKANRFASMYRANQLITSSGADMALLWGEDRSGSNLTTHVSGRETYTTRVMGLSINDQNIRVNITNHKVLSAKRLHFKNAGYVICTNSSQDSYAYNYWSSITNGADIRVDCLNTAGNPTHYRGSQWDRVMDTDPGTGAITFDVNGFPDDGTENQLQITNIVTGQQLTPSNGKIRLTLESLESAILKIEAAPGWGEGGTTGPVAAPVITSHPASRTVGAGASATFSVSALSAAAMTYAWQRNTGSGWSEIGGATSASYTTPTLAIGDDGNQYRCIVTNEAGSATSNAATLTVNSASFAPVITAKEWSLSKDYPTTITFNGTVDTFNANLVDIYVIWSNGTVDGPKYKDREAKSGTSIYWEIAYADGVNFAAQRVVFKAGAVVVNGVALPAQTIQFPPS